MAALIYQHNINNNKTALSHGKDFKDIIKMTCIVPAKYLFVTIKLVGTN